MTGRKARTFGRLLAWAQKAAPMREDALSDIGLAWPLLRAMLLELGERLTAAGVVGAAEDVFWLRGSELQAAIGFGLANPAPAAGSDGHGPGPDHRRPRTRAGRRGGRAQGPVEGPAPGRCPADASGLPLGGQGAVRDDARRPADPDAGT